MSLSLFRQLPENVLEGFSIFPWNIMWQYLPTEGYLSHQTNSDFRCPSLSVLTHSSRTDTLVHPKCRLSIRPNAQGELHH